jgi:hypothetical protein
MASSNPKCMITYRVSGPCDGCGQKADPGHLVDMPVPGGVGLYCATCCQECRSWRQRVAGWTKASRKEAYHGEF